MHLNKSKHKVRSSKLWRKEVEWVAKETNHFMYCKNEKLYSQHNLWAIVFRYWNKISRECSN